MIGRREFITLLGGAAPLWPPPLRAQQPERMRRIGIFTPFAENDPEAQSWVAVFHQALEGLGWKEGRNLSTDYRWGAGQTERFRDIAAELVSLKPDVILAAGATGLKALQQETRSVPIVFVVVTDPVGGGFVASLSRPGGNVTGFSSYEFSIGGKWLETLKELSPGVTRVAVILHAQTSAHIAYLRTDEAAAPAFGVTLIAAAVHDLAEIERAITLFAGEPNGGLVVLPHPVIDVNREQIIALAARHRLPAVYPYRFFAQSGGLMFYGIDVADLWRRAASYVDRILKGTKPAELPVQQPTKFDLIVNLKTARALGLEIPPALLARADEVIE